MPPTRSPTCLFVGSVGVGKSELLASCVAKQLDIGRDTPRSKLPSFTVSFQEAQFSAPYTDVECLALCVDVNDERTLDEGKKYLTYVSSLRRLPHVLVLGTKIDKLKERRIPWPALEDFAQQYNSQEGPRVFYVSSRKGMGISLFIKSLSTWLSYPQRRESDHASQTPRSDLRVQTANPLLRIEFDPGLTFEVDLRKFAENAEVYVDRFVHELHQGGYAIGKGRSDITRRIALAIGSSLQEISPKVPEKSQNRRVPDKDEERSADAGKSATKFCASHGISSASVIAP